MYSCYNNQIMGNWIFTLPAWDPLNYFTKDIVFFLLAILMLISGILICFWGYKYLLTLIMIVLGCVSGFFGLYLMDGMTENPILLMFFFVMWVFWGECLFYFISVGINKLLKERHVHRAVKNVMVVLSPFIGGGIIFLVLLLRVYTGVLVDLGIAALFVLLGAIYQKKEKINLREFKSYDDLYRMREQNAGRQS